MRTEIEILGNDLSLPFSIRVHLRLSAVKSRSLKGEPRMDADERRLNEITERIIGCAYDVGGGRGSGFLEGCGPVVDPLVKCFPLYFSVSAKKSPTGLTFFLELHSGTLLADLRGYYHRPSLPA
jgi:hypothetical protein